MVQIADSAYPLAAGGYPSSVQGWGFYIDKSVALDSNTYSNLGVSMELEERFWSKADWSRDESACWPWLGSKDSKGYGTFKIGGKRGIAAKAHRLAFELERGHVPLGLVLDHLCRNHACVNPWHLEPVTNQENVLRGRSTKSRTHCAAGHEYNEENYRYNSGSQGRYCAQCNRDKARAAYRRKVAA
jgi:hypothetical protein